MNLSTSEWLTKRNPRGGAPLQAFIVFFSGPVERNYKISEKVPQEGGTGDTGHRVRGLGFPEGGARVPHICEISTWGASRKNKQTSESAENHRGGGASHASRGIPRIPTDPSTSLSTSLARFQQNTRAAVLAARLLCFVCVISSPRAQRFPSAAIHHAHLPERSNLSPNLPPSRI